MKTVKTRSSNRSTYTYVDAMGKKHTLKPGDVDLDSGYVLTEEDIKMLHRMDDREVDNNLNNNKPPIQPWEKPILEEWKRAHPYEDLPSRSIVSLDAVGEDDEGSDDATDKGYICEASLAVEEEVDAMREKVRDVVRTLRTDQQVLYKRIIENEENMCDVAKEMGVDSSAIRHRMKTIREAIKNKI